MNATESEVILTTDDQPIHLPARISEIDKAIQRLKQEYADVPDVTSKQGLMLAKSRRTELVSLRTDGDRARLAFTKPLRERIDTVNDAWNDEILPQIKALEDPLDKAIKAERQRLEEIKRLAVEAERSRKEAIQSQLLDIGTIPGTLDTLEAIDSYTVTLDAIDLAQFDEYEQTAVISIHAARSVLVKRRELIQHHIDEDARLKAQAEEQDRVAADQAAAQLRHQSEQRAAAEKLANERRDFEAQKSEEANKQARQKADAAATTRRMAESVIAAQEKKDQAFEKTPALIIPDKEKLIQWIGSVPELPEMKNEYGKRAAAQCQNEINIMKSFITKLDG